MQSQLTLYREELISSHTPNVCVWQKSSDSENECLSLLATASGSSLDLLILLSN